MFNYIFNGNTSFRPVNFLRTLLNTINFMSFEYVILRNELHTTTAFYCSDYLLIFNKDKLGVHCEHCERNINSH